MNAEDVLEVLEIDRWGGPIDASLRERAVSALESGRVLCLPHLGFPPEPGEAALLTQAALDDSRKNISLDPRTGRCNGSGFEGEQLARLSAMLDRFGRQAEALMGALAPGYVATLERARTSFRPAEIAGRSYSPRHDDRRLHVDAFPTRPMRGKRILRLFTNIAPEPVQREWRVGEPFDTAARRFVPRLRGAWPGQFWAMDRLGLTKGRRSAYDHMMLGLHDAMKLDADYQSTAPNAAVSFAPGTTWICYTDQVLHAAMSGRFALEQTFHLPVEAMAVPARSPLRMLEAMVGGRLA